MKKNSKIINIKINKDKLFPAALSILLFFALILIIVKIIVPLDIGIVGVLLALIRIIPLLDTNFKFIAGVFFLVLLWYIFKAFIDLCFYIMKAIKSQLNKQEEKSGRTNNKR